jgi:DNA-binding beta-propeller fold protein YncE
MLRLAFLLLLAAPLAAQPQPDYLYVCQQDAALVTVFDTETFQPVDTVDIAALGFGPNAKPHHVAVEPEGAHWYVSLIGANRILKFNRANELLGEVETETPGMLKASAQVDYVYAGRSLSAVNPPPTVLIVDREAMEIEEEVDVLFPRPHAMNSTPHGMFTYTASLTRNQMAVIATQTNEVTLHDIPGSQHTIVQFGVSPTAMQMVGTGQTSGQVLFWNLDGTPHDPQFVDSVFVGGQPWHAMYNPVGDEVYVPLNAGNAVAVIDAHTREVLARIEAPSLQQPYDAVFRPDGRYAFVSGNNLRGDYKPLSWNGEHPGTVTIIDTQTREVVGVLEVGPNVTGLGIRKPVSQDFFAPY